MILTYTDPFLLEQIRNNNHLLKTFRAMWVKSSPPMSVNSIGQVEGRCSRMHHTDRLSSHLGAAFGLQSEQQPKKPMGHIEVHWTALNEHQSVDVSERICGCGWPCHLRHLCCNSFEKAEELEKRDVRGKKRMYDERYREGPVKSQEKGLVTLHRVIHCAAEIITEPSKSAFKASRGTEGESHTQREQNHRKKKWRFNHLLFEQKSAGSFVTTASTKKTLRFKFGNYSP